LLRYSFSFNTKTLSGIFLLYDCEIPVHISEIFRSIQGEGLLAGTPAVFVRTTGCNLRCGFCDTAYASWNPTGQHYEVSDVLDRILRLISPLSDQGSSRLEKITHVVITGGEPMLQPEMVPLTRALAEQGLHITIETAATLHHPVSCNLMSLSPKLSNSTPQSLQERGSSSLHPFVNGDSLATSKINPVTTSQQPYINEHWIEKHEHLRINPGVIRKLTTQYTYQIKFVIDQIEDVTEVDHFVNGFPEIDRSRVLLMPQATSIEELESKSSWIQDCCHSHGFQFSSRLHITQFGNVPGT
jgi:7-carboxy-7-deazaguanine synthase